MQDTIILSTAYLAPIQYYSKLLKYDKVFIEMHENFIKQTYRNRCKIYGANGELSLSIPVKKTTNKVQIKDLMIDYDTNWQKLHWKSIESAYRSSPYFEYYADDLKPFYEKKYKFLFDFNSKIQQVMLEHLDVIVNIKKTESYIKIPNKTQVDFRNRINPKKQDPDPDFNSISYTQVFHEKHGFIPNLSIIDLLFNEGPNTVELL